MIIVEYSIRIFINLFIDHMQLTFMKSVISAGLSLS